MEGGPFAASVCDQLEGTGDAEVLEGCCGVEVERLGVALAGFGRRLAASELSFGASNVLMVCRDRMRLSQVLIETPGALNERCAGEWMVNIAKSRSWKRPQLELIAGPCMR